MLTLIENYKKLLFTYPKEGPSYRTYAIVDSIRDARIKEKMIFSELTYTDLWDEALVENEQKVPLYLIELQKEDSLTDRLITNHSKGATLYLQSRYDIKTLQAHYSGYTFPYIETDAKGYEDETPRGIFGFYDPLIFPRFVRTLYSREKRERFFAAADLFIVPSPSEESICEIYSLNADAEISLKRWHTADESPKIGTDIYLNPFEPHYEVQTIDARQVEILEAMAHERFVKEVLTDLKEAGVLQEEVEDVVAKTIEQTLWAREYLGIESQANTARVIQLSLTLPDLLQAYGKNSEFIAIKEAGTQLQKRELLETVMKKPGMEEVV